jgi:transposase
MRVELSDPNDLITLRARVAAERRALPRDRCRAVLLAAGDGVGGAVEQTRAQIAAALGRSRQFVDQWVGRYRKLGLAGLDARKARGNAPALTAAERDAFRARMLAGPTDADGGKSALRGRDAQRIVEAEFGKPLRLSTVYALMHRVGLSCLRPRPQHRKNDPVAMAAWLERAPLLSTR